MTVVNSSKGQRQREREVGSDGWSENERDDDRATDTQKERGGAV